MVRVLDRGRKPVAWSVDRASKLWNGLESFVPIWENGGDPFDVRHGVMGALVATTGSATWGTGEIGPMIAFNQGGRDGQAIQMDHLAGIFDGLTEVTMAVVVRFTGTANANEDTLCGQWEGLQGASDPNAKRAMARYDSNNQQLDWFLSASGGDTSYVVSAPDMDDGEIHTLIFRWDGAEMATFFDTVELGARTAFTGPIKTTANSKVPEFMGGHVVTFGGTDSPRMEFYGGAFWSRGLADAECKSLGADFFQMIRPRDDLVAFVAAAVIAARQSQLTLLGVS